MKTIFSNLLILFLSLLLIISCKKPGEKEETEYFSKILEVELWNYESCEIMNDYHFSFNGDGSILVIYKYAEEFDLAEKLSAAQHWIKIDKVQEVSNIVGIGAQEFSYIPDIKNGYYFYKARYEDSEKSYDIEANKNRYTDIHFTFAIYDKDTMTLYAYELDT